MVCFSRVAWRIRRSVKAASFNATWRLVLFSPVWNVLVLTLVPTFVGLLDCGLRLLAMKNVIDG